MCWCGWCAHILVPPASLQVQCWGGARNGDIRVVGINTDTFRLGRIELCVGNDRRVVCAEGWDEHAAMVVCRHLSESGNLSSEIAVMRGYTHAI